MAVISSNDFQNVALAISAYSDEAYTSERKLNSTGIVGSNADINDSGESFIGQMRYYKPLSATINVANLTSATDGTYTDISTDIMNYVKSVRTVGSEEVNMQQVISKQDGLAKLARDFAEVRAQDEHNALLSCLKGVALSEVTLGDNGGSGNGGLTAFTTDVDAANTGLFVDINDIGEFGAAATGAGDERKLFDSTAAGAARGERLFKAVGMAFKDYEPDFMYLVTSPEVMAQMRAANLIDQTIVEDGNLEFQTIFAGKFRLVLTRADQMISGAAAGDLNARSTKCSFVVKPGAMTYAPISTPIPVEIDRTAASYAGGGSTRVWYRYGMIMHPMGYTWAGSTSAFATNTNYGTAASWTRKMSALNLGILPIFHS
jgi:hypothetical protein